MKELQCGKCINQEHAIPQSSSPAAPPPIVISRVNHAIRLLLIPGVMCLVSPDVCLPVRELLLCSLLRSLLAEGCEAAAESYNDNDDGETVRGAAAREVPAPALAMVEAPSGEEGLCISADRLHVALDLSGVDCMYL